MKQFLLLVVSIFLYRGVHSQEKNYWQQQVDVTIKVSLNDTAKTLDGFENIRYYNHSPDTLTYIWLHLWPNAYKNDHTAFSDQLLENGRTDFYFSNEDKRGYINRLNFTVDQATAFTEDHPVHQDIIKLILPNPLAPGHIALIETPFHVKLPVNFSRGGYIGKSFQLTQWYPKPAVYDKTGWHEIPYLDQGEFYSEFGTFDVELTVPKEYVVAATGSLKNQTENGETKMLHYVQDKVHDFAWFADKDFEIKHDTIRSATHIIDVYACYNKAHAQSWQHSTDLIKNVIKEKSTLIGEYPYNVISVVEKPGPNTGDGMEYPTICLVSSASVELINHETGHNWFYGILATNERLHPWMDEGMNTYYDDRYMKEHFGVHKSKNTFLSNRMPDNSESLLLKSMIVLKKDQPIETPSEKFSSPNYDLISYTKTAEWMKLLENEIGHEIFDSAMRNYYQRWKFKHPYPEDFKNIVEEVSGRNCDSVFALLNTKGNLQKVEKKTLKITSFASLKETDKHNYIFLSPAVGYNYYDKFMIGGLIHNYTLPSSKFLFFVAPLYATGSQKMNGSGRISYNVYPGKNNQKFEIALAGSKFTVDEFTDGSGKKNYLDYNKIVPSLKYVLPNKDARSHVIKFIQWKTFLINETGLLFSTDTATQSDVVSSTSQGRYLNQLQFVFENSRVLYPYKALFEAEQANQFIRLNFTGNYFFNYPRGGGLDVRLFAGKFIYTTDKTFLTQYETDRYQLNMTGPKGYEDYTYSNYFIGRNEFEGLSNQQIMTRDGNFKVRTDLLSEKIGKTDDWLAAINFSSSIPKQFNPLSVLPVKIPLKLFLDIGTYADRVNNDAERGKFLYAAGLQVSILNNLVNIYLPVIYSKVYKDYFKSTITEKRFVKNISFSIDIQNVSLKKFFPSIPF